MNFHAETAKHIKRLARISPLILALSVASLLMLFFLTPPNRETGKSEKTAASREARQQAMVPPIGVNRAEEKAALMEPLRPRAVRAPPEAKPRQSCGDWENASELVTVADEETPILLAPSPTAKPLSDWNGEQRLLDPRYDLKFEEKSGAWIRVSVVSPNWPPGNIGWSGWIEEKHIQRSAGPFAKKCLFVDTSKWPGVPAETQATAREVALEILRQDERCRRISRGGFLGTGQRFYFTCYPSDGGRAYHYWLTPSNARRTFAPPAAVEEDVAMSECRKELRKALSNRALLSRSDFVEPKIETLQARQSRSVYFLSIDYQLASAEAHKAYCIVAPGQPAEITLGDPS